MNALKILFIIAFVLYTLIFETAFWGYFLSFLIPYYLVTQILLFNDQTNTLKKKALISMWCSPYDPQILGTMSFNLNKLKSFLEEYSKKVGYKVGITCFYTKLAGVILQKFPQINGNIVFGKVKYFQ